MGEERTFYFTREQADWAIHLKEAWAIWQCLLTIGPALIDKCLLFQCDNKAVADCFDVGSRDLTLNQILKDINLYCVLHGITTRIAWIPTTQQLADEASRLVDWNEEIFNPTIFPLFYQWLQMDITLDAMSQFYNTVCPWFVSRAPDPRAWATDFFKVKNFGENNIYVFPPKPMQKYAAQHLVKYAMQHNWVLIWHIWTNEPAWTPLYPTITTFNLSEIWQEPITLLPTRTYSALYGYYEPNDIARATIAIINAPFREEPDGYQPPSTIGF